MKVLNFQDKLLTIKDASDILNVSEVTVKRYIKSGALESLKLGKVRRIKPIAITNFINRNFVEKKTAEYQFPKIIPGYMGNKSQIVECIRQEILKITKKDDVILDLFAGSGVVGHRLANDYRIVSNDVEPYSAVINSELLLGHAKTNIESVLEKLKSDYDKNLKMLEASSLQEISDYQVNNKRVPYILFTSYFAESYFSRYQCEQIDSIRYAIDQQPRKIFNLLMCGLIFSCYQTVTSVGSHFAQPKINKDKNLHDINRKRELDIFEIFTVKIRELNRIQPPVTAKQNLVYNQDYHKLMSSLTLKDVSLVYVDPPYTIDHYSRFYHVLNTLVLYDYPSKTGNGRYRDDRFQSGFSIKSKVKKEFQELVSWVAKNNCKIVISYSDSKRSLLCIEDIQEILYENYTPKSVKTPIKINFQYSGFGRTSSNNANEVLFIATVPKKTKYGKIPRK